jgi:hypothetical protein
MAAPMMVAWLSEEEPADSSLASSDDTGVGEPLVSSFCADSGGVDVVGDAGSVAEDEEETFVLVSVELVLECEEVVGGTTPMVVIAYGVPVRRTASVAELGSTEG